MRIWARLLAEEGQGRNPYRFEEVLPDGADSDGYIRWKRADLFPGIIGRDGRGYEANNVVGLGGFVVEMEFSATGGAWVFQCQRDAGHHGRQG